MLFFSVSFTFFVDPNEQKKLMGRDVRVRARLFRKGSERANGDLSGHAASRRVYPAYNSLRKLSFYYLLLM